MPRNGKYKLSLKAKSATERYSLKRFRHLLHYFSHKDWKLLINCQEEIKVAWCAGYFYAKQEADMPADKCFGFCQRAIRKYHWNESMKMTEHGMHFRIEDYHGHRIFEGIHYDREQLSREAAERVAYYIKENNLEKVK